MPDPFSGISGALEDMPGGITDHPIANKLRLMNARERKLRSDSFGILEDIGHLLHSIKTFPSPPAEVIESRIKELYKTQCPKTPQDGQFYPELCFNGEELLLGTLAQVQQIR